MKKFLSVFTITGCIFLFALSTTQAQEIKNPDTHQSSKQKTKQEAPSLLRAIKGFTPLPKVITQEQVDISDPIDQDLVIGGGEVKLKNNVNGDVGIGGGEIEITGQINGNLHVAGGKVLIDSKVTGDVIAFGGDVRIGKNAKINGYLFSGGGQIDFQGHVNGSVSLNGGKVNVQPESIIAGNLTINASEPQVSDKAQINGEKNIKKTQNIESEFKGLSGIFQKARKGLSIVNLLGQLLVLLITIRFFPKTLKKLGDYIVNSPFSMFGRGLVNLIIVPIAAILFMMTMIGIPLGLIILTFYALALYFAKLVTATALGIWFVGQGLAPKNSPYSKAIIGLLALTALSIIPFVGGLIKLTALLLGLGAFFQYSRKVIFK